MKSKATKNKECPLCNRTGMEVCNYEIKRFGQTYNIYKCLSCDLAVTEPFPEGAHLLSLYSSDTYRSHEGRFIDSVELFIRRFRRSRLRKIKEYCSRGRILDIGCGRGLMLSMAKEDGWDTYGLEFNDETAFHARDEYGLDVRTGSILEAGFESGTFDVITIWHVLEHVKDPVGTIRECHNLLKPGGTLAIAVPNTQSLQAWMSGKYWFHLDIPYHLYHFSTPNIKMLLQNCSFKLEQVKHFSFEQNPFGFLQSIFNVSGIRYNLLYDILKTRDLRVNMGEFKDVIDLLFTVLLLPLAVPLSLMLSVSESALGRGGTIEVYATKSKV
jgi:SAM-dependent methyltransferase